MSGDLARSGGLFWSWLGEVLYFAYTKYSLIFLLFILERGSGKGEGMGGTGERGSDIMLSGGRFGGCVSFVFIVLLLSHKFSY